QDPQKDPNATEEKEDKDEGWIGEAMHAIAEYAVKVAEFAAYVVEHGKGLVGTLGTTIAPSIGTKVAPVLDTGFQLLSEPAAKGQAGEAVGLIRTAIDNAESSGKITIAEQQDLTAKLSRPGGPYQVEQFLRGRGAMKDCMDPIGCSRECTGLGKLLKSAN